MTGSRFHREQVRAELEARLTRLPTTIWPGSPRSMSVRVCHAEVPDAVEEFIAWLLENDLIVDGFKR